MYTYTSSHKKPTWIKSNIFHAACLGYMITTTWTVTEPWYLDIFHSNTLCDCLYLLLPVSLYLSYHWLHSDAATKWNSTLTDDAFHI